MSVSCIPDTTQCSDGAVRLVGGRIEQEGRVEVCLKGIWGSVCRSQFSDIELYIMCSYLGYHGNSESNADNVVIFVFTLDIQATLSSVMVHLEVVRVQYYEGLTARAGSRIWQSVSTAHSNIKMNITYTVTLTVQQLFAAATVSLYHDNTAISYCFSLTQFVVLVMYVWWVVPTAQVV